MILDLIGYKLDKALIILKNNGFNDIKIEKTASPKELSKHPSRESRVVKITDIQEKSIKILVCN